MASDSHHTSNQNSPKHSYLTPYVRYVSLTQYITYAYYVLSTVCTRMQAGPTYVGCTPLVCCFRQRRLLSSCILCWRYMYIGRNYSYAHFVCTFQISRCIANYQDLKAQKSARSFFKPMWRFSRRSLAFSRVDGDWEIEFVCTCDACKTPLQATWWRREMSLV